MADQHPITLPPGLANRLWDVLRAQTTILGPGKAWDRAIALAYAAGADQELEACCALMDDWGLDEADLRAARRPQPQPTLKEQALKALEAMESLWEFIGHEPDDTIRRALDQLP